MTLLSRLRPWRTGAHRPETCVRSDDAAERWQRYWNVAFYLLLGGATVIAQADPAMTWSRRAAFALLATMLLGWYRLLIVSGRVWTGGRGTAGLYFGGLGAAFVALVLLHPAAMLLTAALYWQMYSVWPLRWSIPGSAGLSALLWFLGAWQDGTVTRPTSVQLTIFAVSVGVGGLLAAFIDAIIGQSRERQRLLDQLAASRRELAAAERQAGIEQERQRLSGEIHDTLAQGFASIVVHLEAAETAVPVEARTARSHVEAARRAARGGLAESRRLVWALRPETLDRSSLPAAIARTAAGWTTAGGAKATSTVVGSTRRLAPEAEVALLRATQEALANVAKHAAATRATVTLSYLDDAVALDVQDDGVGFEPEAMADGGAEGREGGFGLIGMRERVAALGGTVAIESEAEVGTTVAVILPAPPFSPASATAPSGGGLLPAARQRVATPASTGARR